MAESLFTSQTPTGGFNDGSPGITTSTTLKFAVAGTIDKIRWYVVNPFNGGTWTGLCWEVTNTDAGGAGTGTLLNAGGDAAGFTPTVDAWNEITLASPISVVTNKLYRVGMHNDSRYCLTNSFFNGTDLTNGNITAHQNGADPLGNGWAIRQGAFVVSATTTAYPTAVGTSASYFVDVVFTPEAGGDVDGQAAQTITFGGASVAAVARAAQAAQTASFTAAAAAAVARAGQATQTASLTGEAAATVARDAQAAQTVSLTGAATATVTPGGSAAGTLGLAGSASAAVVHNAQAAGVLGLAGAAVAEPDVTVVHRGNWGSLRSIYQANLAELERVRTEPIRECPNHQWPLEPGRTSGTVHCRFGGEVFDLHGNPVLIS